MSEGAPEAAPEAQPGPQDGPGPASRAEPRPEPRPEPRKVPWFADGLRFECTACGKCCLNHGDGFNYVYSTRGERRAIAKHLGLSLKQFEADYCEKVGSHLSFISEDNACVFLEEGKCSIYEHRPSQCSTFPFWPELLSDEDTWEEDVASFCPGVGEGPVHELDAIRAVMRRAPR